MDGVNLDLFFDNFNEEIEKYRIDNIRRDKDLKIISDLLKTLLTSKFFIKTAGVRKFQNPYLYYRIDIKNISSVQSTVENIKEIFSNYLDEIFIDGEELEHYILYAQKDGEFIYDKNLIEDYLLIKTTSAKNGTTAIELMIITNHNPSVIKFEKVGDDYEICYLLDNIFYINLFTPLFSNKYVFDNLIFIPENSRSPFDSSITLEQ